MKRVKRSKKGDERNVNDPFMNLPNDMIIKILMTLPPKSIARLRFASKHLSLIILDKEFIQWYMNRSSTQPRYLISLHRRGDMKMQRFQSLPQDRPYNHVKVSYKMDPNLPYVFTPPVRGLICGRDGTKMKVGNPSTGQFVSLPRVKTRRQDILSVFGYEPVNDVYKVLCMTVVSKRSNMTRSGNVVSWEDIVSEEHQVITLGAKEKWRMVECKYPHRHYSGYEGIYKDGFMYYLACYKKKRSLMSFDLSSEDFNVIKLPEDKMLQQFGELVDHVGKITIANQTYNRNVDLWVLEDANKEVWSKFVLVPPVLTNMYGMRRCDIELIGILGTGKMIFATLSSRNPFFFFCCDPKSKKVREIVIRGIGEDYYDTIQVFFDHVESCMVL
ncbi:unnamed protein product [Eruca vesicaria subsp. sativa]|uniref:F-box domain-containing protein n=1 Tax=Eruca vesicaria subsp. sativa TaxID=29727 RepID=A0ABC8LDS3_ERUVS|nr:unnamed protein product [Eruca vesicaria subsp. sativa]